MPVTAISIRRLLVLTLLISAPLACTRPADATPDTTLTTVRVASGLTRPLFVTAPPGDTDRLFIVEQGSAGSAAIKILDLATGDVLATPFFSISGITTGGERGLLGLAFHPNYADNGLLFINYTDGSGDTQVERLSVSEDPNVADPGSAVTVFAVDQPYSNHNGGWMAFGPDGYLYISLGDGGSGGDPGNRAQDITDQLLGKMLRIDVDADDWPGDPNRNYGIPADNPFVGITGDDEIWAYGLRNAWRCAFDRETGDLYIADVGQSAWEEINFQPAGSPGGDNYGWRCYEGNSEYNTTGCDSPDTMVFPIYEYSHDIGCSITGGMVYRGGEICDVQGTYFFADYCSDQIWSFRYDGNEITEFQERTAELTPDVGSIGSIVSFGEDAAGELYICDLFGGEVFKIVPDGPKNGDMNNDGDVDFDDISAFVLGLSNRMAFITQFGYEPEGPGDLDCNGAVDFDDIVLFVALIGT